MEDHLHDEHHSSNPRDYFSVTHAHVAGLLGAKITANLTGKWGWSYIDCRSTFDSHTDIFRHIEEHGTDGALFYAMFGGFWASFLVRAIVTTQWTRIGWIFPTDTPFVVE
jgi:hypothetical protein